MKRILIIGEHSYIGNSFLSYCSKSEHCEFEIDKVGAVNGVWRSCCFEAYDVVFLVAGLVHRKEKREERELYQKINRDMAVEIAEKAKNAQVKQIIFLSTMAVFGGCIHDITSKTKTNPTTYYGKSKLEAEKRLLALSDKNFVVTIVRPPMVYGLNCPGNFSNLKKLADYVFFFPKVRNQRSMIYIETLCAYIENIIKKPKTTIYHVQNKEYVITWKMFAAIRRVKGKYTCLVRGLDGILHFLGKGLSVLEKIFGNCYYDTSILENTQREIPIENEVDFLESIRRSMGHF